MTENKPIMIDRVDVSGCKFWKGYCRLSSLCDYAGHLCECTPNCYFKQLSRKTHECEELSKNSIGFAKKCQKLELEIFHLKDKNNVLTRQLDQLKAENEEYKKKFQEFFNIDNQECWNTAFLQDEKAKSEQKLELIRKKVQAYIDDEADLTPEQVIQIIDEVE